MEKLFWVAYTVCILFFVSWAIREQIRRNRKWRLWELKDYLNSLYEIPCPYCVGTGYEDCTSEGDPNGEICEHCDSYGFLWRAICPPRWLKHSNTWRQTEIEQLQKQVLKGGG